MERHFGSSYADRRDAGRILARSLLNYRGREDVTVLALPRGGVPVAAEVAGELGAPLDVLLVRKLGAPGHEELALGAIGEGGSLVLNREAVAALGVSDSVISSIALAERRELERRLQLYRCGRSIRPVAGRTVILVDDGLATGSTMEAALATLRTMQPRRIVVAVPVGSREACLRIKNIADELVCPLIPGDFASVGEWYEDFSQTTDGEVRTLLQ